LLGQDPYANIKNNIPQAIGLAFSVDKTLSTPSSLQNIYKNLVKFNHIQQMPKYGDLSALQQQGVLLLNCSLTVQQFFPNSHAKYWQWFTDHVIEKLALHNNKIHFVLWGKNAIDKIKLLHDCKYTASSHPSGLSCNNKCGKFPAFNDCDFAQHRFCSFIVNLFVINCGKKSNN
jgi:uracil-DNA glycosylase